MGKIEITPLGAGQDVGKSCIIVKIGGKNIMLDCGVHMGLSQEKFPDFRRICGNGNLDNHIDCALISHFHLDHCAALPHMTETIGYNGPIYMSAPTKAICPILLEDFSKIFDDSSEYDIYTNEMIANCMKKVKTIKLHEVIQVDEKIQIKAYYAGHVLGAVMFHVKVDDLSFVYTGDFHMTSDSHLGSAWIDRCHPNVLISESTYAETLRLSKKCREANFLHLIHKTIVYGGKVLIPVFALGRAQELCILLNNFWKNIGLDIPLYISPGMTQNSIKYYKLFISWTNDYLKGTHYKHDMFDFSCMEVFKNEYIHKPGPMVVLASPGMLNAGLSLKIFKEWASDPKNVVIIPGYCVANTVGSKLLQGCTKIELDSNKKEVITVNAKISNLSFSAHADALGILQLINYCRPQNAVVFVHGEASVMGRMRIHVEREYGVKCLCPENLETIVVKTNEENKFRVSTKHLNFSVLSGNMKLSGYIYNNSNKLVFEPTENFKLEKSLKLKMNVSISFKKLLVFGLDRIGKNREMIYKNIDIVAAFKYVRLLLLKCILNYINSSNPEKVLVVINSSNKLSYGTLSVKINSINTLDEDSILSKSIPVMIRWNLCDNDIATGLIHFLNVFASKCQCN